MFFVLIISLIFVWMKKKSPVLTNRFLLFILIISFGHNLKLNLNSCLLFFVCLLLRIWFYFIFECYVFGFLDFFFSQFLFGFNQLWLWFQQIYRNDSFADVNWYAVFFSMNSQKILNEFDVHTKKWASKSKLKMIFFLFSSIQNCSKTTQTIIFLFLSLLSSLDVK